MSNGSCDGDDVLLLFEKTLRGWSTSTGLDVSPCWSSSFLVALRVSTEFMEASLALSLLMASSSNLKNLEIKECWVTKLEKQDFFSLFKIIKLTST